MNDFVRVLAISLLPAAGNILGALVAESVKAPPWIIGAALHGAAGVAIAVVSVDLMPRRLPVIPTWMLVAAFAGGAAFSVALARGFKVWAGGRKGRSGTWMVYLAVAADLLTDGLMVGAGSAIAGGLGFLLGLSQVVANVPGDFATIGNFWNRQVRRSRRLVISARFALPARRRRAGFRPWPLPGDSHCSRCCRRIWDRRISMRWDCRPMPPFGAAPPFIPIKTIPHSVILNLG